MSLHTFLNALPSVGAEHPLAAARGLQKKGIAVPYPMPAPTEDTNWKVAFEKPEDITVVGSWLPKLTVKAQDKKPYRVDLAVEMPSVSVKTVGCMREAHRVCRVCSKKRTTSTAASSTNGPTTYQSSLRH